MNASYVHLMSTLPDGMGRDVLWVLTKHLGQGQAITGPEIAVELRQLEKYREVKDLYTKIRTVIREMRSDVKQPILICSNSNGEGAKGYYLPETRAEFDGFIESEFDSRIRSLSVTRNVLVKAADAVWGKDYQVRML